MECLIRKMFCIALNFIFTFARGVTRGVGQTWLPPGGLQPCFIHFSDLYALHSNKNNACQKGLQFILCIMFFSSVSSALHFILPDRLTDVEEKAVDEPAKCAPAAPPSPPLFHGSAATLEGCKSELICLRNQAKVTRRRNCGLHSSGEEGKTGREGERGLH